MLFDLQRARERSEENCDCKQINQSIENMQSTGGRKRAFSPPSESRDCSPPLGIEVVGRHALLFDDDSTAEFINSSNALLPWNGDSNLVLDRYDVRHLLQDLSGLRKKRVPQPNTDVTEEELDFERYRDLDSPDDPDNEETSKRQKSTVGGYKGVPFSYGTEETSTGARKAEDGMEGSDFKPPFWVPDNLLDKLPPSEKIHQIIARTAKFVSDHGGQSEIVLRVKQGNNPVFGFLMPDHHLHIYFRFLVDHPELLEANKEADMEHTAKTTVPGEGLSLLGSVYGTGDDEDEAGGPDTPDDESSIQDQLVDDPFSKENGMAFEQAESSALKHNIEEDICSTQLHKALNEEYSHTDKQSPILEASGNISGAACAANVTSSNDVTGNKLQSCPVKSVKSHPHKANAFGLEPPLFLKRIILKMVEFIVRNGKEFEAIVRDQDRKIGRFPFLLPANKYHPYYLKVLEASQQAKSLEKKSTYDNFGLATDVHLNQAQEASQPKELNKLSGGACGSSEEDVTVISSKKIDAEKKPKFKIVIGGIKKDGNDLGSCGKPPGMTSEVAAYAVRAATKRPANLHVFSQGITKVKKSEKEECGMSTDAAAAIVMAATRGLRRPMQGATSGSGAVQSGMLEKIRKSISEDSEGIGSAGVSISQSEISHCPLSNGDLTCPQPGHGVSASSSKLIVDGDLTRSVSAEASGASGSILKLDDRSIRKDDVSVAKVMVKAAALAAAREADSSEACLSREDKRKAERLKRAKMFAALIKSGQHVLEDTDARSNPSGGVASVLHEVGSKLTACVGSPTVASPESGPVKSRVSVESAKLEQCEDFSKALTVSKEDNKSNAKSSENEIDNHHHHRHSDRHRRTRSHHNKHDDNKDDNERRERKHKHESHRDHKHSEREIRNRHHDSSKSSRCTEDERRRHRHRSTSSEDEHRRHRHHPTSSEDEHRRHRHHPTSSEDEHRRHRHRSSSKDRDSQKRHDRHESPEDGYSHRGKDNSRHKHQKRSRSMREQDSTNSNIEAKVPVSSVQATHVLAPQASQPAVNTTDVPEDLRAKVRAMLLATM